MDLVGARTQHQRPESREGPGRMPDWRILGLAGVERGRTDDREPGDEEYWEVLPSVV